MPQCRSNGGRCRHRPCKPAPHPKGWRLSTNALPIIAPCKSPSAPPILGAVGSPCGVARAGPTAKPPALATPQGLPPAPIPCALPPRGRAPNRLGHTTNALLLIALPPPPPCSGAPRRERWRTVPPSPPPARPPPLTGWISFIEIRKI